jgi:predicted CXXCH cytochrome family protein
MLQPGSCGKCHAAHTSKAKRLLPTGEKELCLGCHGVDNLGVPPLKNIKTELEGKKYLHGPLKNGKCTGCHDPHGSGNFRLLTGPYPETLYAPYKDGIYDFCLKCHNKSLLRFAESTIYTNFRNGKRNLHYVHVVNSRKGRTCRICHAPHAGNGEKLIHTDGLRFGEWNIPLNFKSTATGGSCAPGCHRSYTYDRDKPVVYGGYTGAATPASR